MGKFLFFLLFIFSVLSTPVFSYAHDISKNVADVSTEAGETTQSASTESASVDYALPYPGLLSDNPLYSIKAIRDRIIEFLISDPVKKADFYLLQADKRLNEGAILFEKGNSKYQLAESTISKGENYFEKGLTQLRQAKERNLPVDSLIQKYHSSSHKHRKVLGGLIGRSTGDVKQGLIRSQERVGKFAEVLDGFEPKK